MAVDVVARALALAGQGGSSNYDDLENKPIIDQDLEADGFTPVANTYYKHKDNGEEPQPVYSEFVVGENLPAGALMHVDTTKEQEMLDWAETLSTNAIGYPFYASDSATVETAMVCGVMPAQTTGSEDAFVIFLSISTSSGTSYLPIYSTEDFDMPASGSTVIEFRKGFHNLDQNGNVVINPTDSALPIVYVGFSPNQSMSFDNFNWNGRVFSICEIAVKPYHDGSIYYYDGEAYHEIIGEGATDDAPILNADFYAKDFAPENGRTYRQIGTSKYVGPIEHEQGSRSITIYLDMDMPTADMVAALNKLIEDEVEPMTQSGGLTMWSMIGDNTGGGLSSISILHVDAHTQGMEADTDFWQIGIFGGLFSIWNSAQYIFQVEQGQTPKTIAAGWHQSISGVGQIIKDGKIEMDGADFYVFNTQYWNPFASTSPILSVDKNTIARYDGEQYDNIAHMSDIADVEAAIPTVDTTLDQSSNNPIANSAVATALNTISNPSMHSLSQSGTTDQLCGFLEWIYRYPYSGNDKMRQLYSLEFICSGSISFPYPSGSTGTQSDFILYNPQLVQTGYMTSYVFQSMYAAVDNDGVLMTPYYIVVVRDGTYAGSAYVTKTLTIQSDFSDAVPVTGWTAFYYSEEEYTY